MSRRFKVYGWFMDRPGVVRRWLLVNALIIGVFSGITVVADLAIGPLENRWGLTVWYSFVMGFTAVTVGNIIWGLLGLGYTGRRDRSA